MRDNIEAVTLEEYMRLSKPQPDKKSGELSGLQKLWYILNRSHSNAPLAEKDVNVKGILVNYWIRGELFGLHPVLNVRFRKDEEPRPDEKPDDNVYVFRKPFCSSKRKEKGKNLREFYETLMNPLQYKSVVFTAHKLHKHYFIDAVQNGQGKILL